MLLLLLLGLLAAACSSQPPMNPAQQLHLTEGQNYTIHLNLTGNSTVAWYRNGGDPPCLSRGNCVILSPGDLRFMVVGADDGGLYSAFVVAPDSSSEVLFFNISVSPTTIIVNVPKMEFFTLTPQQPPQAPFAFYHLQDRSWTLVMNCTNMASRTHCRIPPNECFFRKGRHYMLEGLGKDGCDGQYTLVTPVFHVHFKVKVYLTYNKTEHAVLNNLFFLSVDRSQGSYPFTWLKGDSEICHADSQHGFSCLPSPCDYDRFSSFSLWGTMSRECAGQYTFKSNVGNVYFNLVLDIHTKRRVVVDVGETVTIGKPDLEKAYFTWYFNENRIAFCLKPGSCECLQPYQLGKGSTLVFKATSALAGRYRIDYNESEWQGEYNVEVKTPVPAPPPKSIIFSDIPKSFRQGKEGHSVALTPPLETASVLWYYFSSEFEFQKVAVYESHKHTIIFRDHFKFKGNKLVIKNLNPLTSGIYLAMAEISKREQYKLKLYSVSTTQVKNMEGASKHRQLTYNVQKSAPRNDSFSLYQDDKGFIDFIRHCHATECYAYAGPGRSFVMSPLYGHTTLIAYFFQKKNSYAEKHPAAPSRKLLALPEPETGSGGGYSDSYDDNHLYFSVDHYQPASNTSPSDYIIAYFLFCSVLVFWLLLMCLGGRLVYICCRKQRLYMPEALQLMKTP